MYTDKTQTVPVTRDRNGKLKFFSRAAEDLGVTRQHLYCVLFRGRTSAALIRRISEIHPELLKLAEARNV